MKRISLEIVCAIGIFFLGSCTNSLLDESMNEMIRLQNSRALDNFSRSLALIELHKVRQGDYPNTLEEIVLLSEQDSLAIHKVEYYKFATGYELNIKPNTDFYGDTLHMPQIILPIGYCQNLGILRSNVSYE